MQRGAAGGGSERVREQERLEQELTLLRAVLTQMPAGVVIVEPEGGRVVLANERAEAYLQAALPEGRSLRELPTLGVHADERPYRLEEWPLVRALVAGEVLADEEIDFFSSEGARRTLAVSAGPVRDQAGRIVAAVVALVDVTERKKAERRLAAHSAASRALEVAAGILEASRHLLGVLCHALGWEMAALWQLDETSARMRCVDTWVTPSLAGIPLEEASRQGQYALGEGLPGLVWASGQPRWVPDLRRASGLPRAPIAAASGLYRALAVPIRVSGQVVGALELFGRNVQPADHEVMDSVAAIGQQIGEFVERRRAEQQLLREKEAAERAFRERDRVARTLQQSLLPPTLPSIPGLEVAARYRMGSEEVLGDFYDVFPLRGRRWGLVVGDVCGRGIQAAKLTAVARHTVRTAAMVTRSPARVLRLLNDALLQELPPDGEQFCTVAFAILEPREVGARLTLASGGHPPPALVRGGEVTWLDVAGTLLGVLPSVEVEQRRVDLDPGDLVVLYTDGLIEAPTGRGERFGAERLGRLLARCSGRSAQEVAATLEAMVTSASPTRADDLAVAVLRVPTPPAPR